jgi:WhiB family transcriptional regulator, redox-sensing transcriptional regulator
LFKLVVFGTTGGRHHYRESQALGRGHQRGPARVSRVERAKAVRELYLLDADAEELGWQERALCAQTDPEAFFPEKGGSTREAKRVCLTCDVRNECLEYALGHDERFGIWGGLSERERRKLKKRAV